MAWSYLPHTAEDRQEMLSAIGVKETMDLFADIPEQIRLRRGLNLPGPLSEPELAAHFAKLAAANANLAEYACFLGAGAYDHHIPSTVDHVLRRSEFYTAYTQYQPEISQGYLQALWEYQSMICALTGMPVANASMYDGATAMTEAAILACGATIAGKSLSREAFIRITARCLPPMPVILIMMSRKSLSQTALLLLLSLRLLPAGARRPSSCRTRISSAASKTWPAWLRRRTQ
jgi:glycine cleavage system pyridoxal-binding protein P